MLTPGDNWFIIFAYALGSSFIVAVAFTYLVRRFALRYDIVDKPGERKMHDAPVPLLGGLAIYATFNLVIAGNLLLLDPVRQAGFEWLEVHVFAMLGDNITRKLIGIFAGAFLIFLLGIVDDVKTLSPELKLIGQIAAALVLVLSGIRLDVFLLDILAFFNLDEALSEWDLTVVDTALAGIATVVWIVMMTNSVNFLDNMDGLAAGVSGIAAFSFFLCVLPTQQYFVCVLLMVFAGSVAGFLYHNLNPARIFMGDAGSMFCGYTLATVAVLGTFYTESTPSRVAVAAPLIALSVPIFDTVSVVYIRWRKGESIMKGDKRHFSHRLVDLGMSPRLAVEFIFLVTAVTGLGAAMLPHINRTGTLIVLGQTLGVFLLIVILMNAAQDKGANRP